MLRGPLVPVDEVVEFKLVDVAGIELGEGFADVLEQRSELFLVIGLDRRARLAPLRLLARRCNAMFCLGHDA